MVLEVQKETLFVSVLHVHRQAHGNRHSLIVERSGAEAETANGRNHRAVKFRVARLNHLDIVSFALLIDIELQHNLRVVMNGGGVGNLDIDEGNDLGGNNSGADGANLG